MPQVWTTLCHFAGKSEKDLALVLGLNHSSTQGSPPPTTWGVPAEALPCVWGDLDTKEPPAGSLGLAAGGPVRG